LAEASATSRRARWRSASAAGPTATPCTHEHSCLRCPASAPDPAERSRLVEISDNLAERIAEAESEGWLGEAERLRVSLDGARHKLAQMDLIAEQRASSVNLGMPTLSQTAARTTTTTDPLGELSTDNESDELEDAAERPGRGTRRLSLDALRA
jgi:methylphosphotriester-DNA--protein-cysteine methyltransferase